MNCYRKFLAALLAASLIASSANAAVLLYEQTFNPPPAGQSGAILPWSVNMIGGFLGTFNYDFALPDVLRDAVTNGELPADTAPELLADALVGPIVLRRLMSYEPFDPKLVPALVDQVLPR